MKEELELLCESLTRGRESDQLVADLLYMWVQKERGYTEQMMSLGATPPIQPTLTNIFKTV